jgi:HSP20 family molecular chaperone IbpA
MQNMKINKNHTQYSLSHIFDSFLGAYGQELRFLQGPPDLNVQMNLEMNYHEEKNRLKIEFILPGYSRDEVELQVSDNLLKIQTKSKIGEKNKDDSLVQTKFRQSFQIPNYYDSSKVTAKLQNGILEVYLPKKVLSKARLIKIS